MGEKYFHLVYWYHTNHLGTPKLLTDKTGKTVWQANSEAFGRTFVTQSLIENNLRFPGQYYDAETDTHYNFMRDYDPATGRYLTSDPIGLYGGINLYGYVEGNPVVKFDNFGEHPGILGAGMVGRFCLSKPAVCAGAGAAVVRTTPIYRLCISAIKLLVM